MKQFYSVLTAAALFLTTNATAQLSQGFETQTEVDNLVNSCWTFNSVSYSGTSPISGTGNIVSQLGVTSEMITPDLMIPSNLNISFSYNTLATASGSKTLKILLIIDSTETILDNINLNSNPSGTFSGSYTNANTPGNNINGIRKIIFRFSNNVSVAIDNLTINAPYAYPGGCAPVPIVLPVKLVSFNGNLNKNKIQLHWMIAENETAKHFEIQRSTNGSDFTTVSVVNGTQKSGTETYGFSEITSSARVLYRLKMYDVDSKAEYSKTLVFTTENSNQRSLKVVTNPVKEKLVISFTNTGSEVAQVNIYDNLGRIMQRQSLNAVEGVNTSTIALNANYRPGLYIVELITKAGKLSEKLIYSNQ